MSHGLIVRPEAESDIIAAYLWYEERLQGLGESFIEELDAAFDRIVANPASFAEVEPAIRRALTRTFPYMVFYAIEQQTVSILAVIHAAQDPDHIADRLNA